jgi:plastocyanin
MYFMKNRKLYSTILVLLISATVITSCSKGSSYNSTTTPPPAANSVSIVNMSFSPATLSVTVGTTVTWTNNDNMTHTVTSDTTAFDSGNLTVGSKYTKVFSVAGTYEYHCTIHPTMKGSIVVK